MKKFLAVALAATAMVWAAGDPISPDGVQLVGNGVTWNAYHGSANTVTVNGGATTDETPVAVSMTIYASDGWAEAGPGWSAGVDFTTLASGSIDIDNGDQPVRVVLVGTGSEGVFGAYGITIPAGHTGEMLLPGSSFAPVWGTDPAGEADLSKVTGLAIIPGIDGTEGGVTLNFTVNSFIAFGVQGGGGDDPCDDWNEWTETTPATCDAPGEETRTSNCDGVAPETRPIAQLTDCGEWPGYVELIGSAGLTWTSYIDTYGEGTAVTVNSENPLNAALTLSESDEASDKWPYLGLGAYPTESNFSEGITGVEIEYSADGGNIMITIGTTLQYDGEEIGYSAVLSSSATSRTLTLEDFEAPQWMWDVSWGGSADVIRKLSDVAKSDIAPSITFQHENYGSTVNIEVSSIKLMGVKWSDGTSITKPVKGNRINNASALAITQISAGKLGLNVANAGNYSIALYGVDGRMLSHTRTNLIKGVNTLSIGKNLAKGVAIIRIKGMNTQLVKKIMVK